MLQIQLTEKKWLKRVFYVQTSTGSHHIEYNGRGIGFESVKIDGRVATKTTSWFWFIPKFTFQLETLSGEINVRVGPTLSIRSFQLILNSEVCYQE